MLKMQRWLEYHNYRRGKRSRNVQMKEKVALQRDLYLKTLFANANAPPDKQLPEVYLDESYIHQHYHKNNNSCWDPNDEQDIQFGKAPAKGNRYCFLYAIQGPNPWVFTLDNSDNDRDAQLQNKLKLGELQPQNRGGVVEGTVWSCCLQQKTTT